MRQRDDEGAVKFGSTVLKKSAATGEDEELLQDALSLLGYNDPASSPCGNLLGTKVGRATNTAYSRQGVFQSLCIAQHRAYRSIAPVSFVSSGQFLRR